MSMNKLVLIAMVTVLSAHATLADFETPVSVVAMKSELASVESVTLDAVTMQITENNTPATVQKRGFFKPWMIAIPAAAALIAATGGIAAPFLAGALGAEAAGAATLAAVSSNASYLLPLGALLL
jgi:hypothetical protein